MKSYSEIDAADLFDLITKPRVLLVDVRNDDEVARGVIPGAVHIQLAMLPIQYEKLMKANTVVFYCHSGVRSAHAADFAVNKGVKNVFNLVAKSTKDNGKMAIGMVMVCTDSVHQRHSVVIGLMMSVRNGKR